MMESAVLIPQYLWLHLWFAMVIAHLFERYGYELANDIAPTFNFGAQTDVGARIAVPVIRI